MPHDVYGNLLKVGDKVVIPGVVTAIYGDETNTSCNVNIELDHSMPAYPTQKTNFSSINTRQVVKVHHKLDDAVRADTGEV